MHERSYYDDAKSSAEVKYKLYELADKQPARWDDFMVIASMVPPPMTVHFTNHILMIYIGKHKGGHTVKYCEHSCWRDSQVQLKKIVHQVKNNKYDQKQFTKAVIQILLSVEVADEVLKVIGQTVRADLYVNENSLKSQSQASYLILSVIMARVRMLEIEQQAIEEMELK